MISKMVEAALNQSRLSIRFIPKTLKKGVLYTRVYYNRISLQFQAPDTRCIKPKNEGGNYMSILSLLSSDGFIVVNRKIAEVVGLEAAAVLGELASEYLYWQEREGLTDGFFYSTVENLEERVYLSAYVQRQSLEKLQALGLIEVERKGMPSRRFIRLDEEKIAEVVNDMTSRNLTTGDKETSRQDVQKLQTKNKSTKKKEEVKQGSKKNEAVYDSILSQVQMIANDEKLFQAFRDFIQMRTKIKAPLTERALKMIINESVKLSGNDAEVMRKILNQSILNCWKGVYPLKSDAYKVGNSQKENNPFTEMLASELGYGGEEA